MEYKKRSGTSGISGQLFETKLLCLFLFRLQHDERVHDFCLATNMDEIGNLDDVCIQIKIKGRERPLILFMQLKHKDNDDAYLTFDKKTKTKYIDSYIKIKNKINSQKYNNAFFGGNITVADCLFILYTNAEFKFTNSVSDFANIHAAILHDLIATSDTVGCQLRRSKEDFEENILMLLAQHLVKFLNDEGNGSLNMMNDEYIQRYHVILLQNVVDVSDIQSDENKPDSKWRLLKFRDEFFDTNDRDIALFRNYLLKEVFKEHPNIRNSNKSIPNSSRESSPSIDKLISCFLSEPSAATLASLIWTHIACDEDGKLKFLVRRPLHEKKQLELITTSTNLLDAAILAASADGFKYLKSLQLKVPITFGNVDLAIRGKRLDHLVTAVVKLCQQYEQKDLLKVVTIDDTIDSGLLKYNGGLASGVGNILVYDKETNMLKFSNDTTSLQKNSKAFFKKLNIEFKMINGIKNLHEYRFDIKTCKLPKLHLDCTETAKEFLDNFVIYGKQGNHSKVEEILKQQIQQRLNVEPQNVLMNNQSVFLHYHEEILKWWMTPIVDKYLTKASNLYEQSINNIRLEPRLSDLHTAFYMNNLSYFRYKFNEEAIEEMKLPKNISKIFVITNTVTLTTVKVIQSLRSHSHIHKYAVVDLRYVFNLSTIDLCALSAELRKTAKVVTIVYSSTQNNDDSKVLREVARSTQEKQLIFITNHELAENVKQYFSCTNAVFKNEIETLSAIKSYQELTKKAKVVFQDQEASLDSILDDESLVYVKGGVLDNLIRNETVTIGSPLSNLRYNEIENLYVERRVCPITEVNDTSDDDENTSDDDILLQSFDDINRKAVLVTAPPGMGKSTLLTHLSLNTRKQHTKLFIVRINFIDHSRHFYQWHEDETLVDALESLKFLCQVILRNKPITVTVSLTNGEARLETCTADEMVTFELNMFLHFYNKRRLVLVFDGFDEICPYYKDKVLDFLKVTKIHIRQHTMWVTSRPCSDILTDLQKLLGSGYRIKHLNFTEQETYLNKFWREKLIIQKCNEKLQRKLQDFIDNTMQSILNQHEWICNIYFMFYKYISSYLPPSQKYDSQIRKMKADYNHSRTNRTNAKDSLARIPLLLYFIANYFVNIDNRNTSFFDISMNSVYKHFIEYKIKVRFQDKRKGDLYDPDIIKDFQLNLDKCLTTYKNLAAHALFQENQFRDFKEFNDMKPLEGEELKAQLRDIKTGTDKMDLISHITCTNIPVFIHRSFTEYFTAEYICDKLKNDKIGISLKRFWYYAIMEYSNAGVIQWLCRKKEVDVMLRRVIEDINKHSPIFETVYRKYFNGYHQSKYVNMSNMSKGQHIRILASSVDDYETGCFNPFGARFQMNFWNKLDLCVTVQISEYIKSYFVSKMKPHLKIHFFGPSVFRPWYNNIFAKNFDLATNMDEVRKSYSMFLKIKILEQEPATPLFVRLEPKDTLFKTLNVKTRIDRVDNDKTYREKIDDTNSIYIIFNNTYRHADKNEYHESAARKLNSLLCITGAVGCRLHYSEECLEDIAKNIFEKEISKLTKDLGLFVEESHKSMNIMNKHSMHIYLYHVLLRQKVFNVTEIQSDEYHSEWRNMTFRDEFFVNRDKNIALFRSCLLDETLRRLSSNLLQRLHPDELILSFLSEPSALTLTPLIEARIVCFKNGRLEFLIERPPTDLEQLRQINIPRFAIDDAQHAVEATATEYLRARQLNVPIAFGNVDLLFRGTSEAVENKLNHLATVIFKLCEQSEPHKIVTIDKATYCTYLAETIGNVLICDEDTDMLEFSNPHALTAAQTQAKSLLLKLSHKMDNLNEYRFHLASNYGPRLRLDYTNTAREFISKVVIYAEKDQHYELKGIMSNMQTHTVSN